MRTTATRRCRSLSLPPPRSGPATHCILRERSTKATTAKAFGGSGCVNRALVFRWPSGRTFRPKRSKNSSWAVFLCYRRRRTTSDFRFTDIFVHVNVAIRISIRWPNHARFASTLTWRASSRVVGRKRTPSTRECVYRLCNYAYLCA